MKPEGSLPHSQQPATLSSARSVPPIPPHPTSLRSILILPSYPFLGLPSGLFTSGLLTKALYAHLLPPIRATCTVHLNFLELIKLEPILGHIHSAHAIIAYFLKCILILFSHLCLVSGVISSAAFYH